MGLLPGEAMGSKAKVRVVVTYLFSTHANRFIFLPCGLLAVEIIKPADTSSKTKLYSCLSIAND